jgi:3-hydroxyisobutyrate dehydrogenase
MFGTSYSAIQADTLQAARDAEIIILSLPSPRIVSDVIGGDSGIHNYINPGSVVIDLSTIDPATARSMATILEVK